MLHPNTEHYPRLLDRMKVDVMLFWRLDEFPSNPLQQHADKIQLTLFAVSQSPDTDRLISWPIAVNLFYPEPSEHDFPDSSLFTQVRSIGSRRSAI